jgi:hypothetical protein
VTIVTSTPATLTGGVTVQTPGVPPRDARPERRENALVARAQPGDFGLTETVIDEIRRRDEKQARLFVDLLRWSCGLLWLALTVLVYGGSARRTPVLALVMAPLLGGMGAVIGGLPLAIVSAVGSWLRYPSHPQASALERYEVATAGIRVCDVCRLARGDDAPKDGVAFCGRCAAWICPDCRRRYDLRAIAALKRARSQDTGSVPASEPRSRERSHDSTE